MKYDCSHLRTLHSNVNIEKETSHNFFVATAISSGIHQLGKFLCIVHAIM